MTLSTAVQTIFQSTYTAGKY